MVYVKKGKSTPKQIAYARRVWGGQGESKREVALDCGYPPSVANSVKSHIEDKDGFKAAMAALASESNNLAMEVMWEFKRRGLEGFGNQELVNAMRVISGAWEKFYAAQNPGERNPGGGSGQSTNRLRAVILQQVENQTVSIPAETVSSATPVIVEVEEVPINEEMDF